MLNPQTTAGAGEGEASAPAVHIPACRCRHLAASHDIGTRKAVLGKRTECSVHSGPKGAPCGCQMFTEAPMGGVE